MINLTQCRTTGLLRLARCTNCRIETQEAHTGSIERRLNVPTCRSYEGQASHSSAPFADNTRSLAHIGIRTRLEDAPPAGAWDWANELEPQQSTWLLSARTAHVCLSPQSMEAYATAGHNKHKTDARSRLLKIILNSACGPPDEQLWRPLTASG